VKKEKQNEVGSAACGAGVRVGAREFTIYDPTFDDGRLNFGKVVGAEDERRVIGRLFGAHLADATRCGKTTSLEDSRSQGQIVPVVYVAADGAWTAANVQQRMYVVFVGECAAIKADVWSSELLAVTQGDEIVAQAPVEKQTSLEGAFDLDGDGHLEFVLTTGRRDGQRLLSRSARLQRFEGSRMVVVHDFGEVFRNWHDANGLCFRTYAVVHAIVQPGMRPGFRAERKTERCPSTLR
jgi:hypothetical protein